MPSERSSHTHKICARIEILVAGILGDLIALPPGSSTQDSVYSQRHSPTRSKRTAPSVSLIFHKVQRLPGVDQEDRDTNKRIMFSARILEVLTPHIYEHTQQDTKFSTSHDSLIFDYTHHADSNSIPNHKSSTATRKRPFQTYPLAFCRVLALLAQVHDQLLHNRIATLRQLYYQNLDIFFTQNHVYDAVVDLEALLRCPRYLLNIAAGSTGVLAGQIDIWSQVNGGWVDCTQITVQGWPIPGNEFDFGICPSFYDLQHYQNQTHDQDQNQIMAFDSRHYSRKKKFDVVPKGLISCILVIEKYGIFQRLVEDRFFDIIPSVLVCGKGYPSRSTRAMVSLLEKRLRCTKKYAATYSTWRHFNPKPRFPIIIVFIQCRVPVLGLADFNPHGLALLLSYRNGLSGQGNITDYASDIKWLGLRSTQVLELEQSHSHRTMYEPRASEKMHQNFTENDHSILKMLSGHPVYCNPNYKLEVDLMRKMNKKMELEALYHMGVDYISKNFLPDAILQQNYI